jgi:hypothetical protein
MKRFRDDGLRRQESSLPSADEDCACWTASIWVASPACISCHSFRATCITDLRGVEFDFVRDPNGLEKIRHMAQIGFDAISLCARMKATQLRRFHPTGLRSQA